MSLLFWTLTIAWAEPPAVPDWAPEVVEVDSVDSTVAAHTAPASGAPVQPSGAPEVVSHDWVDPANLSLAIEGEFGWRYYLLCTGRVDDHVLHWRQGPYDTPDATLLVDVVPPTGLTQHVVGAALGHLTMNIVATDFGDREVGRWPVAPIGLVADGSSIAGLTPQQVEDRLFAAPAVEEAW